MKLLLDTHNTVQTKNVWTANWNSAYIAAFEKMVFPCTKPQFLPAVVVVFMLLLKGIVR